MSDGVEFPGEGHGPFARLSPSGALHPQVASSATFYPVPLSLLHLNRRIMIVNVAGAQHSAFCSIEAKPPECISPTADASKSCDCDVFKVQYQYLKLSLPNSIGMSLMLGYPQSVSLSFNANCICGSILRSDCIDIPSRWIYLHF